MTECLGHPDQHDQKENTMCEHHLETDDRSGHPWGERARPDWVAQAMATRAIEWSSDRVLDPGDSHDKGELSLCVGEAA